MFSQPSEYDYDFGAFIFHHSGCKGPFPVCWSKLTTATTTIEGTTTTTTTIPPVKRERKREREKEKEKKIC